MKSIFSFISFYAVSFSFAQNLVLNGSFEDIVVTDDFIAVDSCIGWSSVRNTPDYFSFAQQEAYNIPANYTGYQPVCDGEAYVGVVTYFPDFHWNYREQIVGSLSVPLTIGTRYYVSFKTSLAISIPAYATMATNKIGALFTNYNMPDDSTQYDYLFPNFAHVYSDTIIRDTSNWVIVSGSFIADSAYRYIKIGNFFDDNQTASEMITWDWGSAYYYVDDVRVSTDSIFVNNRCGVYDTTAIEVPFTMPSAFSPNGDGVNDVFQAIPTNANVTAFKIYNRWGEKVFETHGTNTGWDGRYKGELQPMDVYAYYVEVKISADKTEKRTGSFSLLR